mmetsp:Transcript_26315/g.51725  ORF Transcript_26315/g.51725 Transcript_26315/m.51725 type:complete len:228 (+) Transcript_26315:494-1177(+)
MASQSACRSVDDPRGIFATIHFSCESEPKSKEKKGGGGGVCDGFPSLLLLPVSVSKKVIRQLRKGKNDSTQNRLLLYSCLSRLPPPPFLAAVVVSRRRWHEVGVSFLLCLFVFPSISFCWFPPPLFLLVPHPVRLQPVLFAPFRLSLLFTSFLPTYSPSAFCPALLEVPLSTSLEPFCESLRVPSFLSHMEERGVSNKREGASEGKGKGGKASTFIRARSEEKRFLS